MASDPNSRKERVGKRLLFFVAKLALLVSLGALTAVGYLSFRSRDPLYVVRELMNWRDYRRFDGVIIRVAGAHSLDPRLVKAVVWRESRFQSDMVGRNGERGLMQVSPIVAREWAAANGRSSLQPPELLEPELNLEIGAWYLAKAMQRWNDRPDAVPFALAEYNAGRSRVDRWIREAARKKAGPIDSQIFEQNIDFPSTLQYIRTIMARYDFYKRRGPLVESVTSAANSQAPRANM
jgi:soluble lytic murein transglycosylase